MAASVADETVLETTSVKPHTDPSTRPKRQPPYAVVLHNDDLNGFDFVISVLKKVFGYTTAKTFRLTLTAHLTGRSHVWTGPLEVAELKADQIRSCGPDPANTHKGAQSLWVRLEPLPQ